MSGRGKRKEEESALDENSEGHAPPKKASKIAAADESDELVVCEVSKNRRVTVRNWQGKVWVDIREFYVKDGQLLPGKRGISLNVDQWNVLRDHVEAIDKALAEA
ncbi:RNA polymerase II transcriptional coactivator KIWI-like [Mercurialis annua]|uniref:RNA polymerase II transcriptional coactivator KIWI-like n=1 Tax=Mercurialis annua TaxID=3986 RepID=UPI00215FB3EA|nr:RNA polymerase II transcriptional coactivator KIWI-like [Mercurialis annua]